MSLTSDTMLTMPVQPAYSNGNSGFGGWGGDWGAWIILFLIFGIFGWGGGFGGAGASGGGATPYFVGAATQADIQRGFDNQAVVTKLDGITQGICSLGYDQLNQMNGINSNISQTAFGIQNSINSLSSQLASCCCETQRAIDGVNYNLATQSCDTRNTIQSTTRDIIDNQNANARAVLDALTAQRIEAKDEKIAELQNLVNSLNLAQSQANQNNYLVNTLRPCPTPAYITCNPWGGTVYGGCNGGCVA